MQAMTEVEAYQVLLDIFQEVFMRSDIQLKPETTAKDVDGWNSFRQVEILLSLEERLAIKFTSKEMDVLSCVGDLVERIVAKTAT
jgi:acyl carrier protein